MGRGVFDRALLSTGAHAETWAMASSLGVSARAMERRSEGRSSKLWWVLGWGPFRLLEGGTGGRPRSHQFHSFRRGTPKSAKQVSTEGGPKIYASREGGCPPLDPPLQAPS